ncbi:Prolyl tripeptidyl peptidase precursor [Lacunisphaera limnophila]|uniref:Prolyl tripeptidyl peptidase n=1 Tax=Lacunisphaera limnophila TaxID=1838286 RepID=A0A1I7PHD6_9BACT|nr:alpha/beta fold hydrolase [Lacunisphaera limnophila]AOS43013.1 Prolyl tripeptidyl peptidase precursor [Lacunisphaera limnophila]
MIPPRFPSLLRFIAPLLGLFSLATAAPPPVSDFVKWPEVNEVRISENGRYVAFLTPSQVRFFDLNVYDTQTKESKKFDLGGDDVTDFFWIGGDRMVITTENRPNYRGRKQVFDVKQGKVTANLTYERQFFQLISSLRRDPNLFVARFFDDGRGSAGLAVISTRLRPKVMAGQDNSRFNVKEWIDLPKGEFHGAATDHEGEVRVAAVYSDKKLRFHYRAGPKEKWIELPFHYETTSVIGFTPDPDLLYVAHYAEEAKSSRLHRYRVSTGDFGPPLFEDATYAMNDAELFQVRQADGSVRTAALGYHRDLYTQLAIDPLFAEIQTAIQAKLPGRQNLIVDCDQAMQTFVVASSNGREPSRYVIYRHDTKAFLPLPAPTPWFKPAEMSVQRPIKFTARDGLVLEGYLSLPAPAADGSKPPLVVYAHGGPWARDTWGYNSDAQFLTSRGYAVFQPNYRGSTGYAKAVSKDDDFEFRKMHDDVTDGVKHLVAQGLVDGKRLAIYGGSFGGYLAVAGVAFEPDLYRCAVTFAGVFDWKQLVKQSWAQSDDDRFNYDRLLEKLGDPATQQERFQNISPIAHIAAVKAPVLVIHGKLDTTVEYQQSTRLLSELEQRKVPHEQLFFDTEFHGFSERENYQKFLTALEKFLAQHL